MSLRFSRASHTVSAQPIDRRLANRPVNAATPNFALASLGMILLIISAGLGYVAHLTHSTLANDAGGPSLLPLIGLAILAGIGGVALLRFALHPDLPRP